MIKIINVTGSVYLFFLVLSLFIIIKFYFLEKIKNFLFKNRITTISGIFFYFAILPIFIAFFITLYTYWSQLNCPEKDIFDGHAACFGIEGLTHHVAIQNINPLFRNIFFSLKIVAIIFMFLAFIKIFYLFYSTRLFSKKLFYKIFPSPEWFEAIANKVNKNLKTSIKFQITDSPVEFTGVIGLFNPVVIIPSRLFLLLNEQELEALMYHEGGHIINRDNTVRFIIYICKSLLFFLPFRKNLYDNWSVERDIICDELAIFYTKSPLSLASAVMKILRSSEKTSPDCVFSAFGNSSNPVIKKRLDRLISYCKDEKVILNKKYLSYNSIKIKTVVFCFLVFYSVFIPFRTIDVLHCFMEMAIKIGAG